MNIGRNQLIALGAAAVVCVLLVFAPRIPSGKKEVSVDPAEAKIAQAVAMVNGKEPMKGIMMLRELAQENPENAEVHWHLGQFSIQSGQYDKAIARFEKVKELDEDGFPDVHFYLGRTYATMDSIGPAIASFEKYKTLVSDTVILEGVDRFLKELKQQKAEQNALR
jgi:lipopolysaccharide biosynthesis regulator YciM